MLIIRSPPVGCHFTCLWGPAGKKRMQEREEAEQREARLSGGAYMSGSGEDVTGNPGEGEQQQQQGHWMHHGGQHVHVHFR